MVNLLSQALSKSAYHGLKKSSEKDCLLKVNNRERGSS